MLGISNMIKFMLRHWAFASRPDTLPGCAKFACPMGLRPGFACLLPTLPFGAWRYRNRSSTSRTIGSATTLALLITLGGSNASRAQALSVPGNNTRPIVGTSGLQPPSQPRLLSENPTTATKVHLDLAGKPCLVVSGYSRPQTINPKIFEHIVSFQNHCVQTIKLKVCHYGSQNCISADVPGYGRKESVLGIYPSLREFRYAYLEQF